MLELMGPVLEQLLGAQPAENPLLDAAALRQSPPQLVVVFVGAKACPVIPFWAGFWSLLLAQNTSACFVSCFHAISTSHTLDTDCDMSLRSPNQEANQEGSGCVPQLSGEALARGGAVVEPLKAALQAAGARLSLPNVAHPVRAFCSAVSLLCRICSKAFLHSGPPAWLALLVTFYHLISAAFETQGTTSTSLQVGLRCVLFDNHVFIFATINTGLPLALRR